MFPTLYIISLKLVYLILRSLYHLISFPYFAPPPTTLSSGNHSFVLCIHVLSLDLMLISPPVIDTFRMREPFPRGRHSSSLIAWSKLTLL